MGFAQTNPTVTARAPCDDNTQTLSDHFVTPVVPLYVAGDVATVLGEVDRNSKEINGICEYVESMRDCERALGMRMHTIIIMCWTIHRIVCVYLGVAPH